MLKKRIQYLSLSLFVGLAITLFGSFSSSHSMEEKEASFSFPAVKRSFSVEVSTVGELEAEKAVTVSSQLKGDRSKLIYLVADGQFVQENDILAKIDPLPFEELVRELEHKYQEQLLLIEANRAFLEREITQIQHENEVAVCETEAARLEIEKIKEGDAPLEISKLNHAVKKSERKCKELSQFLKEIEEQNLVSILGPVEISKVKKQYNEEKETLNAAMAQQDAYVNHSLPSQIKKAEMKLEKALLKKSEVYRQGEYRISKARMAAKQSELAEVSLKQKIEEAKKELLETVIRAPSPGIVVLREEFRGSQRRKPRIGDVLLKNQPLLDLPNLQNMVVKTKVREVDLHKVAVGKPATIEVQAFPSLFLEGNVLSIGVLAQADIFRNTNEKYFEVTIRLNESKDFLRPGMTACATIHSETFDDVLTIPTHSVFRNGNQFFCFKSTLFGGIEKKEITIKEGNNLYAIVQEGLNEGDEVLLNPPEHLIDGA
ncbi:efflux RND transporter periplasmic adaptor subunit [Criblamydia sequanensis]|uniref:RND efflux system, outer membrane lipoprotein n=1 Tax=Candidatus Criblamydia sequanensis CRIB-18 TaxID=1437425 RepID=A0A090D169_9BACT|nr:efflux RND transporter periplasmic adaptor subunit [Criblamydia sequanensis]CDR33650.1 RND efflux system, outer membrane lipoprotein [Criblamydia sequanensis CRIB-18]